MRSHTMAGICAALLLAACPSNNQKKPEPTPATKPAPKLEPTSASKSQAATPESKPASQAASAPSSAPQPQAADAQALAKGLLDRAQVAYSPTKKKIAFTESYNEEGSGAGLAVVFVGEDGKTGREDIEVYTPGDDEEAKVKAALPKIAERLAAEGFIGLPKTEWPEKKEMVSPFGGLEISWKKNELIATRAGEGTTTQKKKLQPEKPFKDEPTAVFTSMTAPIIVVQVLHDPGEGYIEGFNVFTSYEVLPMPQVKSN